MKNVFSSIIYKENEKFNNKFTNGKDNSQLNSQGKKSSKVNPFKITNTETTENVTEKSNIKIFGLNKNYKFDFKAHGSSLFQNLILTASAYVVNNSIKDSIPVKCVWRRLKKDIIVYINDVNSNSYIPTAEDIGYIIEVEVTPIDINIYGSESAFGQYGPISMDNDIKNTLELLLTSGGTKFKCSIYDLIEQVQPINKEIIIYINTNELKLIETNCNDGKEKLLESVKYHQSNPIMKLHPYESCRFTLTFFDFDFQENEQVNGGLNAEKLTQQKLRSEYHLLTTSKKYREIIYLLIQFFVIDEKIKNNKLFYSINYNLLSQETKTGMNDLITEIKALREENSILNKNMTLINSVNKQLKEEMKNLEEDFQITLESINSNGYCIEPRSFNTKYTPEVLNHNIETLSNFELKKKYDELRDNYLSILCKEKLLREENKELVLQFEILKNTCTEIMNENKKLNLQLNNKDLEIISSTKVLEDLMETEIKLHKTKETLNEEKPKNSRNLDVKTLNDIHHTNPMESELNSLKSNNSVHQELNEIIIRENNKLVVQQKSLLNQKEEIEKLHREIQQHKDTLSSLNEVIENLKSIIKEKETINLSMKDTIEVLKKEKNEKNKKVELLQVEYNVMKENLQKIIIRNKEEADEIKISLEEYEEFDHLRKEKDETEALIMQLKSNNQAKDLEIKNLRMLIQTIKTD